MKKKLYSRGHNIEILKEIDNSGGQFTAEEHAYCIEKEFAGKFSSSESLLHWVLSGNTKQLLTLIFLAEHIKSKGYKNILSLGSGTCVLEYLLKLLLPNDVSVVASDFNSYYIRKAAELLPGIIPLQFDFFKDDVVKIKNKTGLSFDVAIFLGSAYVMDDLEFIKLFKNLKKIGVRQILDFEAGYMDLRSIISYYIISLLKRSRLFIRIFNKPFLGDDYVGKFHGYGRSRDELRRLYKKSSLKLKKEIYKLKSYKYVALCEY